MTIVVLGDIHGSLNNLRRLIPKIKTSKALFITGDITGTVSYSLIIKSIFETKSISREKYTDLVYGKYRDTFVKFQIESANKFLKFIKKLDCPVFFTHGNSETDEVREFFTEQSKDDNNLFFLENSVIKYEDWIVVGYGYCSPASYRKAMQTPGEKKDEIIVKELEKLEIEVKKKYSDSNLIKFGLFHEPPYNTKTDFLPFQQNHGGSKYVLNHINNVEYDYVFTGHIHESQGYEVKNQCLIINPGALVDSNWTTLNLQEKSVQANHLLTIFNLKRLIYNTRNHFK